MDQQVELLTRKNEIKKMLDEKRKQLMEAGRELSPFEQDSGETAYALYERDRAQGIVELLELELEKVDDALEMYEQGKYGTCESCGGKIEAERLQTNINTTLCSSCARERNKYLH